MIRMDVYVMPTNDTDYSYPTTLHAQSREASMILKLLCTLLVVNNEHEYRTGVCSL